MSTPANTMSKPWSTHRSISSPSSASIETGLSTAWPASSAVDGCETRRFRSHRRSRARPKVGRSDEQAVEAVDGGDLLDVLEAGFGFDLGDRDDLVVRPVDILGERLPVLGGAAVADATDALVWVAGGLDERLRVLGSSIIGAITPSTPASRTRLISVVSFVEADDRPGRCRRRHRRRPLRGPSR